LPKEKDEARFPVPETATLLRMAAVAPAADIDFQSVEMVDIRLSTASLNRLRLSWVFVRWNLNQAAKIMAARTKIGMITAAATFPPERPCEEKKLLTLVMAEDEVTALPEDESPEPMVAVKIGPAGSVDKKGGLPAATIASWRLTELVEFHQAAANVLL
jgi:hypothetical protein